MHKTTHQLRTQLQTDGYLVVKNILSEQTFKILYHEIENITSSPIPDHLLNNITFEKDLLKRQSNRSELTPEDVGDAIYLIGDVLPFSDIFISLINHAPILNLLENLFGSTEFEFHFAQALIKNPQVGSRVNWHRDFGNGTTDRLTSDTLRLMLCLDGMSEENGATQIIKNSHLVSDAQAKEQKPIKNQNWAEQDIVTLSCAPGSVVILSSKIIHGGGPNRSPIPRRNLISEWAGPQNHVIANYRYTCQGLKPRSQNPARKQQNKQVFGPVSTLPI